MNLKEWFTSKIEAPKREIIPQNSANEEKKQTTEFTEELPMGFYSTGFSWSFFDNNLVENEQIDQYVNQYRIMALHPEVDDAINEIINEAIVKNSDDETIVRLDLSKCETLSDGVKKKITKEFDIILNLLEFSEKATNIFYNYYIDGRLYYEVVFDKTNPKKGIQKLNQIDCQHIKRVFNAKEKKYYFEYKNPDSTTKVLVPLDLIIYVGSGFYDRSTHCEMSWLHKAIKSINNLRNIEDSIVIYRLIRSSEKRIFNVDVGMMNKTRSENYMNNLIQKFRNVLKYDSNTGKVTGEKGIMGMVEDFWFPVNSAGRGTKVELLQAGQNLGDLEDLYYWVGKVWSALNVPESRRQLKGEKSVFSSGRIGEIERDEIKFFKFISKIRIDFSKLFTELLHRQLLAKKIITEDDWKESCQYFRYQFTNDNFYTEIKESEILTNRLNLLTQAIQYSGRFFTEKDLAIKILKMTEEEWKDKQKELKDQREDRPELYQPNVDAGFQPMGNDQEETPTKVPIQQKQEPENLEG